MLACNGPLDHWHQVQDYHCGGTQSWTPRSTSTQTCNSQTDPAHSRSFRRAPNASFNVCTQPEDSCQAPTDSINAEEAWEGIAVKEADLRQCNDDRSSRHKSSDDRMGQELRHPSQVEHSYSCVDDTCQQRHLSHGPPSLSNSPDPHASTPSKPDLIFRIR